MAELDKSWMDIPNRLDLKYVNGVKDFLDFAFHDNKIGFRHGENKELIRCPCRRCCNSFIFTRDRVHEHLICDGILLNYRTWKWHGEEDVHDRTSTGSEAQLIESDNEVEVDEVMDMLHDIQSNDAFVGEAVEEPKANAQKIYNLLDDAETPLYAGCTYMSKLKFILKLIQMKSMNGMTAKCMNMVLMLFKEVLPSDASVPENWYEAKKIVKELGLTYEQIDACKNDCVLFWKENKDKVRCPECDTSRYKEKTSKNSKNVASKVLHYFPLKDRLQRLFISSKTAQLMTWHNGSRSCHSDGQMRHPADSPAWKNFDQLYPTFASECRNVRLGLASDGFNPFGNMSSKYSVWPVVLMVYNLPPWMCMKSGYMMMSLLIPGPKAPGNDIDVYLQPLIEELKDLWDNGLQTYDAAKKHNFTLRAALLWTINDFPGYANLSGWSTKGKLACPVCNDQTYYVRLPHSKKQCYLGHHRFLPITHRWRKSRYKDKFDGRCCDKGKLTMKTGYELWRQQQEMDPIRFGKPYKKELENLRKNVQKNRNWKKKSIFFRLLPYWRSLIVRHHLDVMHIEKNVCDNILDIFNLSGTDKDNLNSRKDLQVLQIRPELHPYENSVRFPDAIYKLNNAQKSRICEFIKDIKVPDGYSSNLCRCVDMSSKTITGLKSHDCHVYMQVLLPLVFRGIIPKEVADPIIELSQYFKAICSKVLNEASLLKCELDIVIILCKLEQIFPPSFFDVMIHLTVHLAYEARMCGPVQYRWMYPIERYLKKLKDYVGNKARVEGSIAQGYLVEECSLFISKYMHEMDDHNSKDRNYDGGPYDTPGDEFSMFTPVGRPIKCRRVPRMLSEAERDLAHLYVLNQVDNIDSFRNEHEDALASGRTVDGNFLTWFRTHVQELKNLHDPTYNEELEILSFSPSRLATSFSGYITNGFRFRTRVTDSTKATQLCGVIVNAELQSGCDGYYGQLIDIVEISFQRNKQIVLFECEWWDVYDKDRGFKVDKHSVISLNTHRKLGTAEPFALASQVEQVFYVNDNNAAGWVIAVKSPPRNYYNMSDGASDDDEEPYQEDLIDVPVILGTNDVDITVQLQSEEYIQVNL